MHRRSRSWPQHSGCRAEVEGNGGGGDFPGADGVEQVGREGRDGVTILVVALADIAVCPGWGTLEPVGLAAVSALIVIGLPVAVFNLSRQGEPRRSAQPGTRAAR